jgi:hypothetical protein
MGETFAEVNEVFVNKLVECDDAEHWFQIDVVGVEDPTTQEDAISPNTDLISEIWRLTPLEDPTTQEDAISPNTNLISEIRRLTPLDDRLA